MASWKFSRLAKRPAAAGRLAKRPAARPARRLLFKQAAGQAAVALPPMPPPPPSPPPPYSTRKPQYYPYGPLEFRPRPGERMFIVPYGPMAPTPVAPPPAPTPTPKPEYVRPRPEERMFIVPYGPMAPTPVAQAMIPQTPLGDSGRRLKLKRKREEHKLKRSGA
jgi:hypothetical protein